MSTPAERESRPPNVLDDAPLTVPTAPLAAAFRGLLERAGYTRVAVEELLFAPDAAPGTPLELAVSTRRVRGSTPLHVLVRLFRLREAIPVEAVRTAFAPVDLDALAATGLLTIAQGSVRSSFDLREHDGAYFVGDRNRTEKDDLPANFVTGVNSTSQALAALTVRKPVDRALDLGAGCGIQAVHAARHAKTVIATDLNPRALNVTAFNAALNGVTNVEVRQGSLFEPVEGERFGLVVANPPFVISPETRYVFRDGGRQRDTLTEIIARRIPDYLVEGGFGHLLCNWVYDPDGDWEAPVKGWLENTGCDAIVLLYHTEDPLGYAAKWLKPQCLARPETYGHMIDRWLQYYAEQGIRGIATGGILLRRRTGQNWFQPYVAPRQGHAPCGRQIERLFAVQDYLKGLESPEALLRARLRFAGRHHLEQTLAASPEGYRLSECRLCLDEPLAFKVGMDVTGIRLLTGCDGSRPLGDLLAQVAGEENLDATEFAKAGLPLIRNLMLMGFLTPNELPV